MEFFELNRIYIENWCEKNLISYANEIFNILLNNEIISFEDIENLFEEINRENYSTEEEYENEINNQEPQEVMQWFLVTDEGYNKFKKMGFPVIKFKELNFYGRTAFGQSIVYDFYYMQDNIKILLEN